MNLDKKLFSDFCKFSKKQLTTKDNDPMYPVLESVFKQRGYDEETKLWYLYLYTTFYHVGSAENLFNKYPKKTKINYNYVRPLLTGIERRGFRGNTNWLVTINSLDKYHTMIDFVSPVKRGGMLGWKEMRMRFEEIKHNGAWSSYKFADLLAHVMHYDIQADDIGSNPSVLGAAQMITGVSIRTAEKSAQFQNELYDKCKKAGVEFTGLDQMETCLCDFHTLTDGRYYVGNDIDMNMKQIPDLPEFWRARKMVFDSKNLGEVNNWEGERKDLKKQYLTKGVI
jgi:hypothetical protein